MSRQPSKHTTWVFGYGSLIWKQDFPVVEQRTAHIMGWARRFWQGSHDHRGNPENPGRVVTLIATPGARCDGVAFRVQHKVFEYLDHREKNGYQRVAMRIWTAGGAVEGVTYRAIEGNEAFLGSAPLRSMAAHVNSSNGPSGSNREYVLELASALRRLDAHDDHVFELEAEVLAQTPGTRGRESGGAIDR